jgi:hypothetical protein
MLYTIVGFEVLTASSMKMAVFWTVAPCSVGIGWDTGTSQSRQNLDQTSGEEGKHQARARKPVGEGGAYHSLARRGGGRIYKREGNSPYQGPSGISGKITRHKEMTVDGRSKGG